MKIKLTRSTQFGYTDNRTIELEIPDGTEDIEAYVKGHIEANEDDMEDDFSEAEMKDEYSDPESIWHTTEDDKGEIIQWQDF